MSPESPASPSPAPSPWASIVEALVRTSPATVGAGASLTAGIQPSVGLFLGLGALTLAANILSPVSKAIGDGLAYRVKRRLEGASSASRSEGESQ